ncbi:uncharacterized protein KY384_001412 [Bacidia gigantensis]|uniref:uncharacterized protein n=1 Tax=Bacidia gigantensis TaxID=2732470 RepID=UPI001D057866|nr:uncharacterized protein KY384_001412 [Bacidia gigantensis]KAG8533671.1 hypothetical protein KY384_001412 [Bacidia gigantensis]
MPATAKQPGTARGRGPSSLSQVSTPPTTSTVKSRKSTKPSLVVSLKISPAHLSGFPHDQSSSESSGSKATPRLAISADSPSLGPIKSDSNATPSVQGTDDAQSSDKKLKQDDDAVKAGVKRELDAGVTIDDQAKAKALQRKRPKVGENGRLDGRTAAAKAMGYNAAAHKLGPKSNQGVINEKLRALDRTGKPCRKWQKTGFKVKSFTGRAWQVPTWRTGQSRAFGEAAESQESSSNDLSKANSSSNIGSDQSPGGDNLVNGSSPIRIAPAPVKP